MLLFMWQAIQVENAGRQKEGWRKVEITGEEGGVSQSHIFPIVAQEEKRGATRDAQSWD